ncbi:hypothetical protein SAMN02745883_00784 [Caminicella sporogenes DSM 14501]|uniref:Uncharacterized protein n=1 Tax=Caminicella sporogenes DSM 14501 TaxID=1121266 RepID=A0A1M6N3U8_9FIRM|nr:DUF6648 family protein [Caminicella sporogenes]RKD22375.1 hypothetical protein BET04_04900 [Caminicella sporogenes]WIF95172.1 hypothetical protein QNI18_00600 [Caminicella sporogenes]SHJ90336.1 hypothetical protein SAMN02745883_00784 [Caminicella sporogenes DSM 14501]
MFNFRVDDNVFDKFFANRNSLIIQFHNGDISKREFIEEHYHFMQRLNLKPFKNGIDSFEKGIYNYQYYNMYAKYCYMKSKDRKLIEKHPKVAREYGRKAGYYYHQKDKSTLKLLEYIDFKNVEAYYIKVKSKVLRNKLYEIVLKDYDNIILHSKSEYMLKRLKEEGVFKNEVRKSLIDSYINTKY